MFSLHINGNRFGSSMDAYRILFVLRLPALLTVGEVAILLGLHPDAIRFLVKEGFLKALGQTENVELKFDSVYIEGLRTTSKWKAKAITAWRQRVHERNQEQSGKSN